jgi:hypothetical protein
MATMKHVDKIRSVADVIEALGGNSEVARYMSWQPSRVSEIKRRGQMKAQDFRSFLRMAEEKGVEVITADLLIDLHWVRPERFS